MGGTCPRKAGARPSIFFVQISVWRLHLHPCVFGALAMHALAEARDQSDAAVSSHAASVAATERSLLSVYVCCCIDMLGQAFTIATMPYYVRSMGGTASTVGVVISTWACGNVVSSLWMGLASDRFGRKPILILSLICSFLGFMFTALPLGLAGPFYVGAVAAFLGIFIAAVNLFSKEEIEKLRTESPQAKARARCRLPCLLFRSRPLGRGHP